MQPKEAPRKTLEEEVDFLNLNSEKGSANAPQSSNKSPSSNFDLLSGFGDDSNINLANFTSESQPPSAPNVPEPNNDIFDPFGTNSNNLFSNFNAPNSQTAAHSNGNQQAAGGDPFGNLGK